MLNKSPGTVALLTVVATVVLQIPGCAPRPEQADLAGRKAPRLILQITVDPDIVRRKRYSRSNDYPAGFAY